MARWRNEMHLFRIINALYSKTYSTRCLAVTGGQASPAGFWAQMYTHLLTYNQATSQMARWGDSVPSISATGGLEHKLELGDSWYRLNAIRFDSPVRC